MNWEPTPAKANPQSSALGPKRASEIKASFLRFHRWQLIVALVTLIGVSTVAIRWWLGSPVSTEVVLRRNFLQTVVQAQARLRQLQEVQGPVAAQTLRQAQASLANARAALARSQALFSRGFLGQAALDDAHKTTDLADAQVRATQKQFDTTGATGSDRARALAMGPALLLADEPTGNLDTKSADDVFALLRRFNAEHGTTVLFVTHNVVMAKGCDRTIEVIDGALTV